MTVSREPGHSLDQVGLHNVASVYWNPTTPHLYEEVVKRNDMIMGVIRQRPIEGLVEFHKDTI